jgi:hypothetical protein
MAFSALRRQKRTRAGGEARAHRLFMFGLLPIERRILPRRNWGTTPPGPYFTGEKRTRCRIFKVRPALRLLGSRSHIHALRPTSHIRLPILLFSSKVFDGVVSDSMHTRARRSRFLVGILPTMGPPDSRHGLNDSLISSHVRQGPLTLISAYLEVVLRSPSKPGSLQFSY